MGSGTGDEAGVNNEAWRRVGYVVFECERMKISLHWAQHTPDIP